MLEVRNVYVSYGVSQVLFDVSLKVEKFKTVCVLGRNGAGKTTLLRAIVGLTPPTRGSIIFEGEDITRLPTHEIVNRGISYVPDDRKIFSKLTVYENLKLALKNPSEIEKIEIAYEFFPELRGLLNRKAGMLSGGEQRMLAIARAMIREPKLLLLDEPSAGLAPSVLETLSESLLEMKKRTTILLVEQNIPLALKISDEIYILKDGMIMAHGAPEIVTENEEIRGYLGVA